jgi:cytochrome c oxidase cbb3-type subunit 3
MADFTSGLWSLFVAGATIVSILACALLLFGLSKKKVASDPDKTGHVWDEDLDEYNNPLPRWWIWLFVITIVYSLAYLAFYPGLGSYEGTLRWSSSGEYQEEMQVAEREVGPMYARFAATDIDKLSADPKARLVGEKLFLTYCTQCHSSDARGSKGFPNLTDGDWLYGGEPAAIKASIMNGRNGVMPAMGAALKEEGTKDVANYVRSLSRLEHDAARAERGKVAFATYCAACHGADGKGNAAVGAPNLTDKTWLYGSSEATIVETITHGRTNHMPAHGEFLGEQRVHVLAAYVYGLSNREQKGLIPVAATK